MESTLNVSGLFFFCHFCASDAISEGIGLKWKKLHQSYLLEQRINTVHHAVSLKSLPEQYGWHALVQDFVTITCEVTWHFVDIVYDVIRVHSETPWALPGSSTRIGHTTSRITSIAEHDHGSANGQHAALLFKFCRLCTDSKMYHTSSDHHVTTTCWWNGAEWKFYTHTHTHTYYVYISL